MSLDHQQRALLSSLLRILWEPPHLQGCGNSPSFWVEVHLGTGDVSPISHHERALTVGPNTIPRSAPGAGPGPVSRVHSRPTPTLPV